MIRNKSQNDHIPYVIHGIANLVCDDVDEIGFRQIGCFTSIQVGYRTHSKVVYSAMIRCCDVDLLSVACVKRRHVYASECERHI
jgi:hypothetical protein